jgi:hypothetical protein
METHLATNHTNPRGNKGIVAVATLLSRVQQIHLYTSKLEWRARTCGSPTQIHPNLLSNSLCDPIHA